MRERILAALTRWVLLCGVSTLLVGGSGAIRPARAASLPADTTYSTAARFSGVGLPLTFESVENRTVPASGPIELGRFVIQKPTTGGDVVFNHSAFAIEFNAPQYHKVEPSSDPSAVLSKVQFDGVFAVEGYLDGTVHADGTSTLKATIDGVTTQGLTQNSLDRTYINNLPFSISDVKVVPEIDLSSGPGGLAGVSIAAQIVEAAPDAATPLAAASVQPVPEPSTFAVFVAASCGLFVARRRLFRGTGQY